MSEEIYKMFKEDIEIEAKQYVARNKKYETEKAIFESAYNLIKAIKTAMYGNT